MPLLWARNVSSDGPVGCAQEQELRGRVLHLHKPGIVCSCPGMDAVPRGGPVEVLDEAAAVAAPIDAPSPSSQHWQMHKGPPTHGKTTASTTANKRPLPQHQQQKQQPPPLFLSPPPRTRLHPPLRRHPSLIQPHSHHGLRRATTYTPRGADECLNAMKIRVCSRPKLSLLPLLLPLLLAPNKPQQSPPHRRHADISNSCH